MVISKKGIRDITKGTTHHQKYPNNKIDRWEDWFEGSNNYKSS